MPISKITSPITPNNLIEKTNEIIDAFTDSDIGTLTEKIGNETMDTTATTITGAIKEIVGKIGSTAIGAVGTTITSAIKAIQDKIAIIYYTAANGQFSISHDNSHRLILNKSVNGSYDLFHLDVGDASLDVNNTQGTFDLKLDSGVTHRIMISDGSDSNSPETMIIRCGDCYIERPSTSGYSHRLNIVAGDGAYLSLGSNSSEAVTGRAYMVAPGGFFINGVRNGISSYSGSRTTSAGGNFSVGFSKKCVVLSAYCNLSDTLVIPYPTSGTGTAGATTWWFHVQSVSGSAIANQTITAVVFYMLLE